MIWRKMGQFEVMKRPFGSEFNAPRNGVSNIHCWIIQNDIFGDGQNGRNRQNRVKKYINAKSVMINTNLNKPKLT